MKPTFTSANIGGFSDECGRSVLTEAYASMAHQLGKEAPFAEYAERPVEFLENVVGWKPWGREESPTGQPGQREWIEALWRDRMVAIAAANGAGKSQAAAAIVIAFMCAFKNAIIKTVAPRWEQVVGQIWSKIRAMHAESHTSLPGSPKTYKWELAPQWSAAGFSTDEEARARGFHVHTAIGGETGPLLVVLDEGYGIAPFMFRAMESWLTKGDCYVLLLGNTMRSEGDFFEAFQENSPYTTFRCSAFDAPDWIVSPDWIDSQRKRAHGDETDYYWVVNVLSEFPESGGSKQLISRQMLMQTKDLTPSEHDELHIGVDVARHGKDRNVATLTRGEKVVACESWKSTVEKHHLVESAKNVMALALSWGVKKEEAYRIHIDIGMGAGVIDRMAEAGWRTDAVDFGSGAKRDWPGLVSPRHRFANRRAELHWIAREMLLSKRASVPEKYDQIWRQAQWPEYDHKEGTDVLFIRPKKELIKRGINESPDFFESWMLTFSRQGSGWLAMRL